MKPPKVQELVINNEYAIGLLYRASRAFLLRIEGPESPVSALASGIPTHSLLVGIYDEGTDMWKPAIIRQSQVLGTWEEYLKFMGAMKKEQDLKERFRSLGIEIVFQSPYVRLTENAAERILNMLEGKGEPVKGTTLRVIK